MVHLSISISIALLLGVLCCLTHGFAPRATHSFLPPTSPSSCSENLIPMTNSLLQMVSKTTKIRGADKSDNRIKSKYTTDRLKRKEKVPHDRTIDRRKSPALWRYDLEYSIDPFFDQTAHDGDESTQSNDEKSSSKKFIPNEPPELMSPAGGWAQLKAAVANGADAVYLGLTSYSARARAANFDPDPTLLWKESNEVKDLGAKLEAARGGKTASTNKSKKNEKKDEANKEYEPVEGQPASLIHAVQYCHKHHVRVYVAFNTLVFDNELHEVQELIEKVWDCGVDAVIVQDVGVAKIVKEVVDRLSNRMKEQGLEVVGKGLNGAPLEIHASTQQSVTCADGVSFSAQRTNATRVVLGRELSLSEITQISTNTDTEIEAFVHGALCVSYSGQCFSSEAWGGRSANRGQCAQACRLGYGLIANGELKHLSFDGIEGIMGGKAGGHEEIQYLLSPQDLCGLEQVEGLVRAGVSCLKIEGRLKDASYVAATTRAYRQAIDAAWAKVMEQQNNSQSTPQRILSSDEEVSRSDLTHVFARGQDEEHDGLTPGFFEGPQHQRLVRGRSPRHRGVHVGRVISSNRGALMIKLDDHFMDEDSLPLKRGDGIVIDRGMPQEKELGGPIYDVKYQEDKAAIRFGREVEREWKENDVRKSTIMAPKGSHVWKTADAEIGKRMRQLAKMKPPKSPAKVVVEGKLGEPLTVRITDERSGKIGIASSLDLGVLEEATGSAISDKSIRKSVGLLGGSQWNISELDLSQLDEGLWCPMSWIKETRRRALENLESKVSVDQNDDSARDLMTSSFAQDELVVDKLLDEIVGDTLEKIPTPGTKLSVLARNYDQVDAICTMLENMDTDVGSTVSEIIVDFLEIEGIRAAVSRIREVKTRSSHDLRVVVASPRIIKPGEEGIWKTLLKTEPDGILVRSTGLLYRLTQFGGPSTKLTIKSKEGDSDVTIPELIGDFSLNAANAISANELLESGLSRITAAYDLSGHAITELATLLGKKASQLEVVCHQHMPIFHTEHCVFARFLSKGNSYQDCGHVCTRNTVHLRDQNQKDNLVLADMGCRNTVFASESQSGVYSINEWTNAGVGHLRIELVDESGSDAVDIVSSYLQFLSGEIQANDVWHTLDQIPDSNGRLGGVGVGSLRNDAERRSGELSSTVH